MNLQYLRIASLNTRSIFKAHNTKTQKEFITHICAREPLIDILCLQEISAFYMQEHLTEDQGIQLQHMFPSTQIIFSKHCAIICLNNKYSLDNASITRGEICIAATNTRRSRYPNNIHNNICTPA
jgi:endonuclease/exonuclease/phosphatase family metal-dependent hydrolase